MSKLDDECKRVRAGRVGLMDDRCRHDLLIGYCKQCVIDGLEARVAELEERIETSQWVAAEELKKQGARVAELEEAARAVCFQPVGKRRTTCNAEALQALDALLPDQSGKGERSQ